MIRVKKNPVHIYGNAHFLSCLLTLKIAFMQPFFGSIDKKDSAVLSSVNSMWSPWTALLSSPDRALPMTTNSWDKRELEFLLLFYQ